MRRVDRDAVDPGTEFLARAEALEVAENPHEDLLRNVLAILLRHPQKAQDAQHPGLMALEQALEGADLTLAGPLGQFLHHLISHSTLHVARNNFCYVTIVSILANTFTF